MLASTKTGDIPRINGVGSHVFLTNHMLLPKNGVKVHFPLSALISL